MSEKTNEENSSSEGVQWIVSLIFGGLIAWGVYSFFSSGSSIEQFGLEKQAIAKMDEMGWDFFCSKVMDKDVTNVTIGTATAGNGGTLRFPAIKANYTGTCISVLNGERDTKLVSEFWIFFALDAEADTLRCYQIGKKDAVDKLAKQCEFKPNDSDD